MLRFLKSLLGGEFLHFKQIVARLVLHVVAMVLLLIAVLFVILSLYLWLSTFLQPWQAALVVAGTLLVVCTFVWVLARMETIRRARRWSGPEIEMESYANLLASASRSQKLSVIATAIVMGLIIGRRMTK